MIDLRRPALPRQMLQGYDVEARARKSGWGEAFLPCVLYLGMERSVKDPKGLISKPSRQGWRASIF